MQNEHLAPSNFEQATNTRLMSNTPHDSTSQADEVPTFDEAPAHADALVVGVDGFEGPLDLLLALARTQKVDLHQISILQLVEQYLGFISNAQRLKLEVAADYLVMAAWLAFLKSRLLLPRDEEPAETATAEELAQHLAFRLTRLEAMRRKAAELMTRHRLDRDVFARGMPEQIRRTKDTTYTAEIYDLLKAYADQRRRTATIVHVIKARPVWSIKDARKRLEQMLGRTTEDWEQLDFFIKEYCPLGEGQKSVRASSFGASLEMAREGLVELRQDEPFAPIYMRKKDAGEGWERVG